MPARQKPVTARQPQSAPKDEAHCAAASVAPALASEHSRNTRRAGKRSATASSANTSAPAMKPSCTAAVSVPTAAAGQPKPACRSPITAFTANQGEVPASCASTSTGSTRRGTVVLTEVMPHGTPSTPVPPQGALLLCPEPRSRTTTRTPVACGCCIQEIPPCQAQ